MLQENNHTTARTFFLLGFQVSQNLRIFLFCLLLVVYNGTICGNLLIITLVYTSKNLHTPMYFFISQLSITDILLTTDIVPNLLLILLNNGGTISFISCMTQFFFFSASEGCECFLLTVMSYDRYVAICNPLRYTSIMTNRLCLKLVIYFCSSIFFIAAFETFTLSMLKFCGKNIIDHFICDPVPMLEIACSGTYLVELVVSMVGPPILFIPLIIIIVSYVNIISTILRMSSNISRQKAFSTCSSHLIVVSIFYWSLFIVYLVPSKGQSSTNSKVLSLLYTVFTPFINPIIYSLRNKDIMKAMQETFVLKIHFYHLRTFKNFQILH